ncbi:hypothetical protein B0J13DRAFT_483187 [Dactylonectria estremocensis]|uniref:Uncharacterized protein n=1 Tax=Dactylonectria estremocensis TaxID=1079267 RepID=A0A9P9DXW6_9HYPO|nr:hypothetical protein B0J13DRAFT_483187 [Dactylonectria estremocensis]
MAEISAPHKFQATILRVALDPSARQNLLESPSWTNFIALLDKEPNWRFVGQGWATDECKLVLLMGWKVDHEPSATFLPAARSKLDELLAPLQSFRPQTPDVFNMSCITTWLLCTSLMTAPRSGEDPAFMEMVTVAGPLSLIEPIVTEIEANLNEFYLERYESQSPFVRTPVLYDFWSFAVFRLDDDTGSKDGESSNDVAFALFFKWYDEKSRTKFQDPSVEDRTPDFEVPDDFWETTVAAPLRELVKQGAHVSSWDYHEADYVRRGRGGPRMMREIDVSDSWLDKAR